MKNNKHTTGISQECHPCVLIQARSAARFAHLTDTQTDRVLALAQANIEEAQTNPILVQHIVRRVADAVAQERGEPQYFDIYAEVKEKSNTLSLAYAAEFQSRIETSASPLDTGIQIAAAGNIIDFGAKCHGDLDLDKELQTLHETSFARYDIEAFKDRLGSASSLLYLCDNCGEIVFDKLFIQILQQEYPNLQITAVFRDKPIINDATLTDAKEIGLDKLVTTISSGSIYPGTVLPETTDDFKALFRTADIILAKGQGNFETLLPVANERLFFLLRIKCDYMASLSGVEKDSLVLMQGQAAIVEEMT